MIELFAILCFGLFLGMRHATDADHVIAVTTIVSREQTMRGAARIGFLWGLGHSITVILVGGAIVWLGLVVSPRLGLSLEFCVALMLVALGLLNLRTFLQWTRARRDIAAHTHPHAHGDYVHDHPHGHRPETHGHRAEQTPTARLDRRLGRLAGYFSWRPVIVGIVHGLAGSAGLALLALPMIGRPTWAFAYLLVFGVGTIAGMMLITAALAAPLLYATRPSSPVHHWLGAAAGTASVCCGLFLAGQILFGP